MVNWLKKLPLAAVFLSCLLLYGCAGEEYTYVDDTDLKLGAGLLSGEDGVFTIYRSPAPVSENSEQEPDD